MVEMALVLPILILLIMGIVEFGRIYAVQLDLNNAVREGARFAAVGPFSDSETTSDIKSKIATKVKNSSMMLKAEDTDLRVTTTFSDDPNAKRKSGDPVKVEAWHEVTLDIAFFRTATFDIDAAVTMRVE
ncbi:MAG: pilus assembly protein [Desulfitobacteriaceae bacterium]|nr:pilus assembly protein [Desulfitobacteriaceae bacterium]